MPENLTFDDVLEQAEIEKDVIDNSTEFALDFFLENQGDVFTRDQAQRRLAKEMNTPHPNNVLSQLIGDRVDPVIQVRVGEQKYVGIIDFHEHNVWYGYEDWNDNSGRQKVGVCARCVEESNLDYEVSAAKEGEGSIPQGCDWEDIERVLHTHYVDDHLSITIDELVDHGLVDEGYENIDDALSQENISHTEIIATLDEKVDDIEIGASLLSGTTIAGNISWHAGNDGPGSSMHADLLDDEHVSDLASAVGGTSSRMAKNAEFHQGNTPQQVANLEPSFPGIGQSTLFDEPQALYQGYGIDHLSGTVNIANIGSIPDTTEALIFSLSTERRNANVRFGCRWPGQSVWKWIIGNYENFAETSNVINDTFILPLLNQQLDWRFDHTSGSSVYLEFVAYGIIGDVNSSTGGGNVLSAPSNLNECGGINESWYEICWDSVSGADGYNIYLNGSFFDGTTNSSYQNNNTGENMTFEVTAHRDGAESPKSNPVTLTNYQYHTDSHNDAHGDWEHSHNDHHDDHYDWV